MTYTTEKFIVKRDSLIVTEATNFKDAKRLKNIEKRKKPGKYSIELCLENFKNKA